MDLNEDVESGIAKTFFVVRSSCSSSSKNSNEDEFRKRQSSVFDILNDLEVKHSNSVSILPSDDDEDEDEDNADTTGFKREGNHEPGVNHPIPVPSPSTQSPLKPTIKDEIDEDSKVSVQPLKEEAETFKIPIGIPAKKRNDGNGSSSTLQTTRSIPSYLAHPEKWTKYTLMDVGEEQMSENTNAAAATEFLSNRQNTKWMNDCLKATPKENGTAVTSLDGEEEEKQSTRSQRPNFTKSVVKKRMNHETKEPVSTNRLSFLDDDDDREDEIHYSKRLDEEPDSCSPVTTRASDNEDPQRSANSTKQLFRAVSKKKRNIRQQLSEVTAVDDIVD